MTSIAAGERSETVGRPRFEGSNICTWIGFKHVMYLVEEAVLDHLRASGMVPRRLYEDEALGVEVVDSDARILTALHMDDEVRTVVESQPGGAAGAGRGGELALRTETFVERPTGTVKAVTAAVRVALRPAPEAGVPAPLPAAAPPGLAGRGSVRPDDPLAGAGNAVVWRWRVPYFYCHWSERLQHSGYLRLLEEVVDLFLAARGISIRTMLAGRRWIPVVPRARVEILADAYMEEEIATVLTVEDVYKDLLYAARMDCYVPRGGELVHTATGRITHGYAVVLDRHDWKHVPFDAETIAALRGTARDETP